MGLTRLLIAGCATLAAAGCSIHPLPEDVTGFDTYMIAQKIRCEARDAIRAYAIGAMRGSDPASAEELERDPSRFRTFDRRRLSPAAQRIIARYDQAAIAYDFTFDMTEVNGTQAGLDFLKPLGRGPFNIGVGWEDNRERQNTQNFRIVDTFEKLATTHPDRYCKDFVKGANWIYPITGTIGLDQVVKTFLDLNQSGNLAGQEGSDIPRFAQTIEFTTKFGGSANPRIELGAIGNDLQLAKFGLTTSASREDIHKVIVALTLPPEPAAAGGIRRGKTIAEERALEELTHQQWLEDKSERRRTQEDLRRLLRR